LTLRLVMISLALLPLTLLALLTLVAPLTLALRLFALTLLLSLTTLALTLALFARPLALSLLALTLAGRSLLLLSLTLRAALVRFPLLALDFAAFPRFGLRLFLTLRRFLLALPLTCGLALRSSAFLSGTGLLTRHALPRCQYSSSQKRGRGRCDEKFVFHENDPPDLPRAADPRYWENGRTAA
jgi:hypothetical protein